MEHEKWKPFRLDQLGFVGRDRSRSRPRNNPDLYGGSYPLFETGDIKSVDLYLSEPKKTYNDKGLAQSKLWNPGTLCITIAANIAETAILKTKACFPDSVVGFVANPEKADVRYVKYYIDIIKLQMQNISQGTTQDNLSVEKLLSFDFFAPPLPTQRQIASILSAYDDLIENNTRRIKILEGMAATIYRQWFVEFRFPGHENVPMVDSKLGLIPQGWEVQQLGKIVSDIIDYRGKTPKKLGGDWAKSGIMALSAMNVKQGRLVNLEKAKFISEELYKKWMKLEIAKNDILMTSEAPLGEVYYLTEKKKICLSQRLFCIRANPNVIKPSLLFCTIGSLGIQSQLYASATGTTVLGIRQAALRKVSVMIPPLQLQSKAESVLETMFTTKETVEKKNTNLRQTRDLLLPKLISGERDVSKLDIDTNGLLP